ncbi:MAG: ParA family protein [Methanothrix sp.]
MRVISVTNQKGGCGKTTTSVNLSAYLAQHGKRILLIDIDPQGAATTGLGVDKWGLDKTIYDVLIGEVSIEDIAIQTKVPNLHLAPTNINLSGAVLELAGHMGREYLLKEKLDPVDGYDYIIIDTPPSLDLLTINALVASTEILVPIQTEYYALEGMSQLLKIVDMVQKRLGTKLSRHFLLTMFDGRTKLSNEVADQVRAHFKCEVFRTVIPRNIRLAEAPSYGEPISMYDPESSGAKAYEQLSEEVMA